jgi:hypothetical protein
MSDNDFLNRVYADQDGGEITMLQILEASQRGELTGINVFTRGFETQEQREAEAEKLTIVDNLLKNILSIVTETPEVVSELRSMALIPVNPDYNESIIINAIQTSPFDDPEEMKIQLQKEIEANEGRIKLLRGESI